MRSASRTVFAVVLFAGCSAGGRMPAGLVPISPGPSWSGSGLRARANAVEFLAETDGSDMDALTRLASEPPRAAVEVEAFTIMVHPVTQAEYAVFARRTGAPEPWIDRQRWEAQGTGFPYALVQRFVWSGGEPPLERANHPVVLVDREDAQRYCSWWGDRFDGLGQLPTEAQWNRAAGGDDGSAFPWGDLHDPTRANTWETGVGDTVSVGSSPAAVSAFGVHDLAGNVFEWTRTRAAPAHSILKGGSWSTSLVEARASARQPAPDDLRHVTVGFRCVFEARGKHST